MPVRHPAGADPLLDPDLAAGSQAIGMAVSARLRELAPALRPATEGGGEPRFLIEELALDPADPADALTVAACISAHDGYVAARGRPGAVSPGALALARVLVWATRAEMLGARPEVRWIGPPARMPEGLQGQVVTASVVLECEGTRARAQAVVVVARA